MQFFETNKFLSCGAGLVNDLFEKCGFSGDDIYGMDSTSMKSLIGIGKGDYHGLGFDKCESECRITYRCYVY